MGCIHLREGGVEKEVFFGVGYASKAGEGGLTCVKDNVVG